MCCVKHLFHTYTIVHDHANTSCANKRSPSSKQKDFNDYILEMLYGEQRYPGAATASRTQKRSCLGYEATKGIIKLGYPKDNVGRCICVCL